MGTSPVADLAIFVAACDDRGFRTAAKRLGLSPASVSERVALLEKRLGVPLLIRTTRSVSPTEAGLSLADRVRPLLNETRVALQDAASSRSDM